MKDLEDWLASPVTREFQELLQEHREAPYQYITEAIINVQNVKDLDLHKISEFRGQVHTFDMLLKLDEFMKERVIDDAKEAQSNDG